MNESMCRSDPGGDGLLVEELRGVLDESRVTTLLQVRASVHFRQPVLATMLLLAVRAVPNNHRHTVTAAVYRALGLATTTEAEHQMKGALLLDVVVGKSAAVLELLAGEDEALLVGGDALLVLNLGLDVVDGVRRLDFEGNRLAGEGLDENLHATTEAEDEVEGGLLLDVVVRESAAILELLAGEDQTLLVWGNTCKIGTKK